MFWLFGHYTWQGFALVKSFEALVELPYMIGIIVWNYGNHLVNHTWPGIVRVSLGEQTKMLEWEAVGAFLNIKREAQLKWEAVGTVRAKRIDCLQQNIIKYILIWLMSSKTRAKTISIHRLGNYYCKTMKIQKVGTKGLPTFCYLWNFIVLHKYFNEIMDL